MVARFGADEFALVIEESPTTPHAARLPSRINAELFEPVCLADRGLAVSACDGIVRRTAGEIDAKELIRAADSTLHQAKRTGLGQWALYDPPADADQRARYKLATAMPEAWENGQLTPCYQTLVRLDPNAADAGRIVAALLRLGPSRARCRGARELCRPHRADRLGPVDRTVDAAPILRAAPQLRSGTRRAAGVHGCAARFGAGLRAGQSGALDAPDWHRRCRGGYRQPRAGAVVATPARIPRAAPRSPRQWRSRTFPACCTHEWASASRYSASIRTGPPSGEACLSMAATISSARSPAACMAATCAGE